MIIYGESCAVCDKELILPNNDGVQSFEIMARGLEPSKMYDGKCYRGRMISYILCRNCYDEFIKTLKHTCEEEK